ncbi:hypothetical protein [Bacteroidetes bacterium endosymbiont of Geopemphigus sp.]|uniref:hypothetical protein n=1 Tax=Bacteroidetes bacterium endosymbiont of Geopemphigus sp. TaxID=2047937 RepID=UPI000CD127BB|nr:hypothetical protein [Bacteroidetes bacterium endosymbiont of Geopemphigus sp.]
MQDDKIKNYKDLKKMIRSIRKEEKSSKKSPSRVISIRDISDHSKNTLTCKGLPFNFSYSSHLNLGFLFSLIRNLLFTENVLFSRAKFLFKTLSRLPKLIFRVFLVATLVFGFVKVRNWWKYESDKDIEDVDAEILE